MRYEQCKGGTSVSYYKVIKLIDLWYQILREISTVKACCLIQLENKKLIQEKKSYTDIFFFFSMFILMQ